jgi:hypothetical protein
VIKESSHVIEKVEEKTKRKVKAMDATPKGKTL